MPKAQNKTVTAELARLNGEGFERLDDLDPDETPCDERGIAECVSIGKPIRSDDDVVDFGQKLISSIASGQISDKSAGIIVRAFQVMTTFKMGIGGHSPGAQINVLQQILAAPAAPAALAAPAAPSFPALSAPPSLAPAAFPRVIEGEATIAKAKAKVG